MIQFQENTWTDRIEGWMEEWKDRQDRQTLVYRALPATAWGPIRGLKQFFIPCFLLIGKKFQNN